MGVSLNPGSRCGSKRPTFHVLEQGLYARIRQELVDGLLNGRMVFNVSWTLVEADVKQYTPCWNEGRQKPRTGRPLPWEYPDDNWPNRPLRWSWSTEMPARSSLSLRRTKAFDAPSRRFSQPKGQPKIKPKTWPSPLTSGTSTLNRPN